MNRKEQLQQLKTFISQGNTRGAILLLEQISILPQNELATSHLIQNRYKRLLEERDRGTISSDNFNIEFNKINEAILNLTNQLEEINKLELKQSFLPSSIEPVFTFDSRMKDKAQRKLGYVHKYLCDRSQQNDLFHQEFTESQNNPFFFCAIHGKRKQSHRGLFRRFDFEYLAKNTKDKTPAKYILLSEKDNEEEYKRNILIELFREFQLSHLSIKEMTIGRLAKIVAKAGFDKIAIHFEVRSTRWKEFTPQVLFWFTQTFCDPTQTKNLNVQFFFFLNIFYEQIPDDRSMIEKMLKKAHPQELYKQKISKALQELSIPQYVLLPELTPVQISYIDDWLNRISESDSEREQLLKTYFPENRQYYDMEIIESRLESIIDAKNRTP